VVAPHGHLELYAALTGDFERPLRVAELVAAAAERLPELAQDDRAAREIAQGAFIADVLDDPRCGRHLLDAMTLPRAEALDAAEEFRRTGALDLGPVRLDRDGAVGHVTIQNHAYLNAEDDASARAMEVAIDVVLLDDAIEVGVLRGGPATHPKYEGRRVFGSGINLLHLSDGRISFLEFMVERELGGVAKVVRGHPTGSWTEGDAELRREKPWIALVDGFAIGGACQWLLVMDRVIPELGAYFSLPARREGIIPGCAPLRLSRFVGERLAREAILFGYVFEAGTSEGRLLAGDVHVAGELGAAADRAASELTSVGLVTLTANRRALRAAHEPLDAFRRYMSGYARDQAHCLHDQAVRTPPPSA
jgi:(3,5-dihydroxyphenyl)acetyl-CoA 1,2-dioxygenase